MKNFFLFNNINNNLTVINKIEQAVNITLGPIGKNGIIHNQKEDLKFITSGLNLLKSLKFTTQSNNLLLDLLKETANKTILVSGDGSGTTVLLCCEILRISLYYILAGYNSILISNGLIKLSHFISKKLIEYSFPIRTEKELVGILETTVGKKLNSQLLECLKNSIKYLKRDGLIVVEENISETTEIEITEGFELDKGFLSSYFVNDLKTFSVTFEKPYICIIPYKISSINQIQQILDYIYINKTPLILIVEEIEKSLLSTLILNHIQKKIKIVIVKYNSINFIKNGLLEDLSLLTHSHFPKLVDLNDQNNLIIENCGSCEKVIVTKNKTTFFLSNFSKVLATRRINELNRELLQAESEYEKSLFKIRMAKLLGNIIKIKIGNSNKYEITEQRQKVDHIINTLRSSLEEGYLPGGGCFYLYLREEISNWSLLNLIGDEFFASTILLRSFSKPFEKLINNINLSFYSIYEELVTKGYPYSYNILKKKIVHAPSDGLIDSTKVIRSILWNSILFVSTLIKSN